MTTGEFIQFLLGVQLENQENSFYVLNENHIQSIEKLSTEKFKTWEWNFGYSPNYSFKNEVEIDGKILTIRLVVEKGIIVEAEIEGDYFMIIESISIKNGLLQTKHDFDIIKLALLTTENQVINSFF
jgi:lipoate-protein ligase A